MSENETMLINLIREHKNPEQALTVALEIIINYLKQPESFEQPFVAFLQESV